MSIDVQFQLNRGEFTLDVHLQLPPTGVTALYGSSGCGKTTLLRAMAGLERVAGGQMKFGGETWQNATTFVPTHRRSIGFVFQEQSLFPHLSVQKNLNYGLKRASTQTRTISLDQAVDLLEIGDLMSRRPDTLSGGERQRVAIARALAMSPQLLLLDEPLASLDMNRRQDILPYIESLRDGLGIPVIYVSHEPEEVARLADHLVLLEDGRVTTSGDVHELFANLDLPIARGVNAAAIVETTVAEHDETYQLTSLNVEGGQILVPRIRSKLGDTVRIRIAARDVSLTRSEAHDTSILNRVPATVDRIAEDGPSQVTIRLLVRSTPILARITRKSAEELDLQPGDSVIAQIKSVALLR